MVGINRTGVKCLLLLETRPANACQNNQCENGNCLVVLNEEDSYNCACFPGYEGFTCNCKYSS